MPKHCTSSKKSGGIVALLPGRRLGRCLVCAGVTGGVVEGALVGAGVTGDVVAVALKCLAISMLAQLTDIKIAPVSCANALSINILSATLPGRVTALIGQRPPPSAPNPRRNRPKPRSIGRVTALTGQSTPPSAPTPRPNRPKPSPLGQDTALTCQSPAPSAESPP